MAHYHRWQWRQSRSGTDKRGQRQLFLRKTILLVSVSAGLSILYPQSKCVTSAP
jgi:hypothetical protein